MKKILLVVVIIIFITLLLPLAIVWLIGGSGEGQSPIESGTVSVYVSEEDCVKDMDINEYLKCVVAAEMPADFEEEALKADFEFAEELICTHILPKKTKATLPKVTTVRRYAPIQRTVRRIFRRISGEKAGVPVPMKIGTK